MQLRDAYPADTATGACFLTQDYDTRDGIIDLDLYLDVLPPFGRLCISPKAVRMLVQTLGLEWPDASVGDELINVLDDNSRLRQENQRLRSALSRIIEAKDLSRIDGWTREFELDGSGLITRDQARQMMGSS